ncbi:MAG: DoxX protein [Chitinophagaceae bacterium]|nr:DoxX protein [Chitinophagaceae bacterium]
MSAHITKLFLRLAIAIGFLSAVADRFGLWSPRFSAWGDWQHFVSYTQTLMPWAPESWVPAFAAIATAAEIIFALFLLIGYKTELFALLSGYLMLIFALSMAFFTGVKRPLDASVFAASAAAFALALMKEKFWEIDSLIAKKK